MNKLQFYSLMFMPYPFIPPAEELPSTWVDLPNSLLRPEGRAPALQRVPRAERPDGEARLRRRARQRAPPDGLRDDAEPEHHGLLPRGEDGPHQDRRDRQRAAAAREPDARRRGDRDARRDLRRADHLRLRARHGQRVPLLRRRSEHVARPLLGGARPDHQGVDRARPVRLGRQVLPPAVRQPLAAAACSSRTRRSGCRASPRWRRSTRRRSATTRSCRCSRRGRS